MPAITCANLPLTSSLYPKVCICNMLQYIHAGADDMSVEMHEPYTYLEGLGVDDLEDLLEDISVYTQLENGQNAEYWSDVRTVAEDQLGQLRRLQPGDRGLYSCVLAFYPS